MLLTEDVIEKLNRVILYDIDSIFAYEKFMENVKEDEIDSTFKKFREDHWRHVEELSAVVRRGGGTPPAFEKDIKGYLISGFTAITSMMGLDIALRAMQQNEKMVHKCYEEAVTWNVEEEVKALLKKNLEDENRHIKYIETKLSVKK